MKGEKLSPEEVQFEMSSDRGEYYLGHRSYTWENDQVSYIVGYKPYIIQDHFLKIYRYIKDANKTYRLTEVPKGHDYKRGLTISLYPKDYIEYGELYKTEYYANEDLTDLVLKVTVEYVRDQMGFAQERTTTRTWIKENEEEHPDTKVTKKYYRVGTLSPIEEGIRRRGNIVKGLQMPILWNDDSNNSSIRK